MSNREKCCENWCDSDVKTGDFLRYPVIFVSFTQQTEKGYKFLKFLVTLLLLLEAATGFEPVNNGFADRRLTTWLCRPWSGKRDLNPRLQPWQGCTLPLSYSRVSSIYPIKLQDLRWVVKSPKKWKGGMMETAGIMESKSIMQI